MFRRRKIQPAGIFIIFIILGFAVGMAFWPSSEPVYKGRKLSAWAKEVCLPDLLSSRLAPPALRQQNEHAVAAIRQIGTNALPLALELCGAKDSWLKRQWEQVVWDDLDGFPKFAVTPAWEKHEEGGNIIWALGPAAAPAIPSLIKLLQNRDRQVARDVMSALPGVGTNAIPPLLELLNHADRNVRFRAALVLGDYFTPQARAAVPVLVECLESQDQNLVLRIRVVHCLGLMHADAPVVVYAIIRQLHSETNYLLRSNYLRVLGNFGTNAAPAVPALLHILESNPGESFYPVKALALDSLGKIDPATAQPFVKKWSVNLTNKATALPPIAN